MSLRYCLWLQPDDPGELQRCRAAGSKRHVVGSGHGTDWEHVVGEVSGARRPRSDDHDVIHPLPGTAHGGRQDASRRVTTQADPPARLDSQGSL